MKKRRKDIQKRRVKWDAKSNKKITKTNKKSNNQKTRKTKKKTARKKVKQGIKITLLAISTLILLGLFSLSAIWVSRYIIQIFYAFNKAFKAWYNFFTYLYIPQEIYSTIRRYLLYSSWILMIILISVISIKFIVKGIRNYFKYKKSISSQETLTSPRKTEADTTNKGLTPDKNKKIIDFTNSKWQLDDIIEIPKNGKQSKLYITENKMFENISQEEKVILLGPKGKDIISRHWEDNNLSRNNSSSTNVQINSPATQSSNSNNKIVSLENKTNLSNKKQTNKSNRTPTNSQLPNKGQKGQIQKNNIQSPIPIDLISYTPPDYLEKIKPEAEKNANIILDLLSEFGIEGRIDQLQIGPRVSRYEIKIPKGTRVEKIKRLSTDIATALGVRNIRLELSVPRKPQTIAIEVPNSVSGTVHISSIIRSNAFKNLNTPTPLVLGLDVTGKPVVEDLRDQPHLLIAGATGSGKSVCINTILIGMLMKSNPEKLKLMLVDPKRVELSPYSKLPHLIFPILTEANEAVAALEWMIREMDKRYKLLKEFGVRSIKSFNKKVLPNEQLPYIVVVIDELADLMMVSAGETEQKITRLAQLARAAGIHLILATQRPSTDVITGLIKSNIPARIAFAVSSQVDSRVILDQAGAEKLLGKGDMLFVSPKYRHPLRIQGAYTSDEDIQKIVEYWSNKYPQQFEQLDITALSASSKDEPNSTHSYDPLLREAWKLIVQHNRVSVSFLQRKLRVGFNRASRIMDELEELGIVSPPEGPQGKRKILRTDYDSEL